MATANELDLSAVRQIQTQISEGGQSEAGSTHGGAGTTPRTHGGTLGGPGAVPKDRERKIGHRRVDEKTGTVTYKKKSTSELMAAIQLGIGQSVGGLSSKPERDLLMQDFGVVQSVVFPSEGSNMTPAHHYSDFRFKTYAPMAFRFFRELFNIRPDDFMLSLCDDAMTELSNPGAGGSIFYISADDEFIIKTAQNKEANFLQKLLPGYYMNLNQNPRTLLPKFYGLYCYQCGGKNIRFVVMNNILPSVVRLHEKYDLKGSTHKRKASKSERSKSSPTLKDLDFMDLHPDGLMLEKDTYDALIKTIQRDCRVLESFKIMDYSLLVGIHNLDYAKKEKTPDTSQCMDSTMTSTSGASPGVTGTPGPAPMSASEMTDGKTRGGLARGKSMRAKLTQYSTPMESIQAEVRDILEEFDDEDIPPGGIPAKNAKGDRLLLYLGIIDILQCYRFRKKFEHTFKSMITDGETISVTRPSFYSERFQKFFTNTVFKKAPSPLKHSPSKRKPGERGYRTQSMNEDTSDLPGTTGARPDLLIDSSTPPPAFSEVIAGARARTQHSPQPNIRGSEPELQRSHQNNFQTIPQQEENLRSPSNMKMRHSPVSSISESTPTFTEFTEGTPSYTASSPSCSSDVLDTNIPNLPMDSATPSLDNSPSKTTATNSHTDASNYNRSPPHNVTVRTPGTHSGTTGSHSGPTGSHSGTTSASTTSRTSSSSHSESDMQQQRDSSSRSDERFNSTQHHHHHATVSNAVTIVHSSGVVGSNGHGHHGGSNGGNTGHGQSTERVQSKSGGHGQSMERVQQTKFVEKSTTIIEVEGGGARSSLVAKSLGDRERSEAVAGAGNRKVDENWTMNVQPLPQKGGGGGGGGHDRGVVVDGGAKENVANDSRTQSTEASSVVQRSTKEEKEEFNESYESCRTESSAELSSISRTERYSSSGRSSVRSDTTASNVEIEMTSDGGSGVKTKGGNLQTEADGRTEETDVPEELQNEVEELDPATIAYKIATLDSRTTHL